MHTSHQLPHLHRPATLIKAARIGADHYDRNYSLPRLAPGLLRANALPSPETVLATLVELEAQIDHSRQLGDPAYAVQHHVHVMIALIGEARALQASHLS